MKNTHFSRRQFLANTGLVLLAVQAVTLKPTGAQAAVDAKKLEGLAAKGGVLTITSGPSAFFPAAGHIHTVSIPVEAILRPPVNGVRLQTSTAFLHHHVVELSQVQLAQVAAGKTVVVEDTVGDHHYAIALAKTV